MEKLSKKCPRCKEDKDISLWSKNKARYDGVHSICKKCHNEAARKKYAENPEKKLKKNRIWLNLNKNRHSELTKMWELRNKEYSKQIRKKYRIENKDKLSEKRKIYYKNNKKAMLESGKRHYNLFKHKYMAKYAKRRAAKLKATPPWLTKEQLLHIEKLYEQAKKLEKQTGVKYHIDHIIPLQGKNVCGLHVPWNLQIITAEENLSKNNKIIDKFL